MQEIANNLWQTSGVTGVAIWESIWDSNGKFHLFSKRRLAEWEREAFAKLMAERLSEYILNPEITRLKVLGNYVYLYIESPFPPLAILTQVDTIQLPDLGDLVLGIQQDCQQAIAIFDELAKKQLIKSAQKLSVSKFFTEDTKKVEEPTVAIEELISAFNQLTSFCSKYIGKTIALKYLEKNRPQDTCLAGFTLDKSLSLTFKGNLKDPVTPHLKEAVKLWLIAFIKDSSTVFTYLPNTVQKSALNDRQKAILFT